jgi:hypothetical protein
VPRSHSPAGSHVVANQQVRLTAPAGKAEYTVPCQRWQCLPVRARSRNLLALSAVSVRPSAAPPSDPPTQQHVRPRHFRVHARLPHVLHTASSPSSSGSPASAACAQYSRQPPRSLRPSMVVNRPCLLVPPPRYRLGAESPRSTETTTTRLRGVRPMSTTTSMFVSCARCIVLEC